MIDLRSWPKKWNDASLRQIATLPENSPARPWPMLGMLTLGLVAGAAIGGYAMSHRPQIGRLGMHAHRMADELESMSMDDAVEPAAATSPRSNHRRKAASEV